MIFLPAKCPTCNGDLQVPDDKDFVTCMYCSATIRVREAISLKIENNAPNLLKLANTNLDISNYDEAYHYYNRVLESDADNWEAWYGKGICYLHLCLKTEYELNEALNIIKTGIKLATENIRSELINKATNEFLKYKYDDFKYLDFFRKLHEFNPTNPAVIAGIITFCSIEIAKQTAFGGEINISLIDIQKDCEEKLKKIDINVYNEIMMYVNEMEKTSKQTQKNDIMKYKQKVYSNNVNKFAFLGLLTGFFLGLCNLLGQSDINAVLFFLLPLLGLIGALIYLKYYSEGAARNYAKQKFKL